MRVKVEVCESSSLVRSGILCALDECYFNYNSKPKFRWVKNRAIFRGNKTTPIGLYDEIEKRVVGFRVGKNFFSISCIALKAEADSLECIPPDVEGREKWLQKCLDDARIAWRTDPIYKAVRLQQGKRLVKTLKRDPVRQPGACFTCRFLELRYGKRFCSWHLRNPLPVWITKLLPYDPKYRSMLPDTNRLVNSVDVSELVFEVCPSRELLK